MKNFYYAALLISYSILPVRGAVVNASGVLGQGGSYTTNTINYPSGNYLTPTASSLHGATSEAIDTVNHRLFSVDAANNRILIFNLDANNAISSQEAANVLGVCTFTDRGSAETTASTFGGIINIAYDSVNQRLFASQSPANRVLMFLVPPGFPDCESATAVFGQADFTHSDNTSVLNGPDDIDVDMVNNRLFVSAQNGNIERVFDVTPGVSGSVMTYIFTIGTGATGAARNTIGGPTGTAYDPVNERLFVSDTVNSRIMVFHVPPSCDSSCDGLDADFELGHTDFVSSGGSQSQSTLNLPDDCTYDVIGNRFLVTDWNNQRIMMWVVPSDADESFNGAQAMAEINNVSWTGGTIGTPPAQNSFTHPESPHSFDPVNNRMFVYEYIIDAPSNGNRILQMNMVKITTASFPAGVVGSPYSQALSISQNQGSSQTFSIHDGSLPAGLGLNTSTGAITGTPEVPGNYTFTIEADDNFADGSKFFDLKDYSLSVGSNATVCVGFCGMF